MSFASKFNKGVNFEIDTKDFTFVKLSDLYAQDSKQTIKIDGLYINKGKLETQPVFISADRKQLINIPSHLTDTAREILSDDEAVNAIKDGKVGFTIYEYSNKQGKKCYSIKFADL